MGKARPGTLRRKHLALPLIAAVAVICTGYFALDKLVLSKRGTDAARTSATVPSVVPTPTRIPAKSIAVLPFANMSEKKDQEYFADGMAEEILDQLVRIPQLTVISRTSSFQYKGRNADVRSIGAALGAHYVVEGSVRKSGGQLRITAQLIDARDGSHRWSDRYDRDIGDALKVQDEIAASLVRALEVSVDADELPARMALKVPAAYDAYLRGRHAYDRYDQAGFEEAVDQFKQALRLDPLIRNRPREAGSAIEHRIITTAARKRPFAGGEFGALKLLNFWSDEFRHFL